MRDLMNSIHPVRSLSPLATAVADNTAQVGQIIDLQGFDSLTFLIATGTLADVDATFTVLVEDSDDSGLAGATAVPDAELIGTEALAGFTFADDNKCRKIGYRGSKRYVRMTITPANNTGAAPLTVIALLGNPGFAPTPNPPQ